MNIEKKLCNHISWLRDMGRFNYAEQGCCAVIGFTYNKESYVFCNVKKAVAIFKFKHNTYTLDAPTVLKENIRDLKSRALANISIVEGQPKIIEVPYKHPYEEAEILINFENLNLLDNLDSPFLSYNEVDENLLKYIIIKQEGDRVILSVKKEFSQGAYGEKRTLLNSKFEAPNKFYTYGDPNYTDNAVSTVYQNIKKFKANLRDQLNNAKHSPDPSKFLKEITNLLDRLEKL